MKKAELEHILKQEGMKHVVIEMDGIAHTIRGWSIITGHSVKWLKSRFQKLRTGERKRGVFEERPRAVKRKVVKQEGFCAGCGERIVIQGKNHRHCSSTCRNREKNHRRRHRLNQKRAAQIVRDELPNEEWREIEGYNGLYEVSNMGRVRYHEALPVEMWKGFGVKGAMPLKIRKVTPVARVGKKRDYRYIMLTKDGVRKRLQIHRLVAQAFIPNPENKPEVNHMNGVKNDNRLVNLEWVTGEENREHAVRTGLTIGKGMRAVALVPR